MHPAIHCHVAQARTAGPHRVPRDARGRCGRRPAEVDQPSARCWPCRGCLGMLAQHAQDGRGRGCGPGYRHQRH
jgi:hypothetical protein